MEKLTYTVSEVAEMLQISKPKAYELTEQADFPLLRLGRKKLIPIKAFHDWLDKVS